MVFDNIILFLNVLEQFAIRVTILGIEVDVDALINYVNKLYFNNPDDFVKNFAIKHKESIINDPFDPRVFVRETIKNMDKKIKN